MLACQHYGDIPYDLGWSAAGEVVKEGYLNKATSSSQGSIDVSAVPSTDRMVEAIRNAILRGMLHPGQHLTQTGLAASYDVSKVTTREVLKQLHGEGLVHHDRNRGYFVAQRSRSEAKQLYRLRRWLEAELLRDARWPDKDELAQLRALQAIVAEPLTSANRERWQTALADMRFKIFDLSPDKTLLQEARRLWVLTDWFRALLPADQSHYGESELIDALALRDREALMRAFDDHRRGIEAMLDEALAVSLGPNAE